MENSFKEEDKQKFIEFLNLIAKKAQFNLNTQEIINYFSLLNHMQKVMLPKIDNHILEVKKVVESSQESKEE